MGWDTRVGGNCDDPVCALPAVLRFAPPPPHALAKRGPGGLPGQGWLHSPHCRFVGRRLHARPTGCAWSCGASYYPEAGMQPKSMDYPANPPLSGNDSRLRGLLDHPGSRRALRGSRSSHRDKVGEAVGEGEELLRSILDNMQDAYARTDRDGRLVMVSPSTRGNEQWQDQEHN
jgi:PAS domain-containing protein